MILRPPRSTRTDTLFPYTTLFRSPFVLLTVLLGFFMSLGNAAVFKHIPAYYPDAVGPVGGLVGMIGALGGFVLPIWFGALNDLTRSEEHTSELQSLMRISYAVFCLKTKNTSSTPSKYKCIIS